MTSKRPSITRRLLAVLLPASLMLMLAFAASTPPAAAAPGSKLHGKWQAQAMEVDGTRKPVPSSVSIIFHFKRAGKFQLTIAFGSSSRVKDGTWRATASKITITIDGKAESTAYRVSGSKLVLNKSVGGKPAKYHLKKIL